MMASREEAYAAAEKLKENGQLEEAVAALDESIRSKHARVKRVFIEAEASRKARLGSPPIES